MRNPIAMAVVREAVQRKIFVWVAVLAAAFLGLFALGMTLMVDEMGGSASEEAMVTTGVLTVLALYVSSFIGSLLAITLGAGSVASELDSGLAAAVLARPVSRARWVLERWAALAALVAGFAAVMTLAVTAIATATTGYAALSIPAAVGMMAFQVVAVLTLAMALSARFSVVAAGVAAFSLFGIAWLAGLIETFGSAVGNRAMVNIGIFVSLGVTSDALWRAASYFASPPNLIALSEGLPFASAEPPTAAFLGWAAVLTGVLLFLAVKTVRRRDL